MPEKFQAQNNTEGEASKEETKASINKKKVSHIIRRIQERHGTSRPRRGHKRKVE